MPANLHSCGIHHLPLPLLLYTKNDACFSHVIAFFCCPHDSVSLQSISGLPIFLANAHSSSARSDSSHTTTILEASSSHRPCQTMSTSLRQKARTEAPSAAMQGILACLVLLAAAGGAEVHLALPLAILACSAPIATTTQGRVLTTPCCRRVGMSQVHVGSPPVIVASSMLHATAARGAETLPTCAATTCIYIGEKIASPAASSMARVASAVAIDLSSCPPPEILLPKFCLTLLPKFFAIHCISPRLIKGILLFLIFSVTSHD